MKSPADTKDAISCRFTRRLTVVTLLGGGTMDWGSGRLIGCRRLPKSRRLSILAREDHRLSKFINKLPRETVAFLL